MKIENLKHVNILIMEKICKLCKTIKPVTDFYKQSKMKDGRQNCCRLCISEKGKEKRKDPVYNEKLNAKKRQWVKKAGYKVPPEKKKIFNKRYSLKYPEKKKAGNSTAHMKATVKGNHLHHWSYNEPHYKDVIELPKRIHVEIHRLMTYDQDAKMYRRKDNGELLDTRAKHCAFIFVACGYVVE